MSSSFETITAHQVIALVVSLIVVPALFYIFTQRRRGNKSAVTWKDELIDSSKKLGRSANGGGRMSVSSAGGGATATRPLPESSVSSSEANCAWEERRRRGIAAHSLHEKKDASKDEKPFGSSYYYAHNSTRATGGYKDGLTMEDYTMNGPRLLSRGGKPVDHETATNASADAARDGAADQAEENNSINSEHPPPPESEKKKTQQSLKRSLPISRYLWDDPGDASKGIATIRIEELPGKRSTDPMIPFKDASITEIHAQLTEEQGLLVSLETSSADVHYELRIAKLYGQVAEVEALVQRKRLLLRLKKKKGLLDKSNLRAWPHPQKKTS